MLLSAINSERMVSAQLLQLAFPAEAVVAFDVFPFSENAEGQQWGWGRDPRQQRGGCPWIGTQGNPN